MIERDRETEENTCEKEGARKKEIKKERKEAGQAQCNKQSVLSALNNYPSMQRPGQIKNQWRKNGLSKNKLTVLAIHPLFVNLIKQLKSFEKTANAHIEMKSAPHG